MATFDLEIFSSEVEGFKDTKSTTWVGKYIPDSVLVLSKLIKVPNIHCKPNPSELVSSIIDALGKLASLCKAQRKFNLVQVETTTKSKK